MTGMMLHRDRSTHRWIERLGYNVDLIVPMDDAALEITEVNPFLFCCLLRNVIDDQIISLCIIKTGFDVLWLEGALFGFGAL